MSETNYLPNPCENIIPRHEVMPVCKITEVIVKTSTKFCTSLFTRSDLEACMLIIFPSGVS